jgi:hypothetical protein
VGAQLKRRFVRDVLEFLGNGRDGGWPDPSKWTEGGHRNRHLIIISAPDRLGGDDQSGIASALGACAHLIESQYVDRERSGAACGAIPESAAPDRC